MLEIKNAVVVVVFISLKHNGLCRRLADSNYFYTEKSILHEFLCMHNTIYVHFQWCNLTFFAQSGE